MAIMFKIDSGECAIRCLSAGMDKCCSILITYSMCIFLKEKFTKNKLFNVSDKKEFIDTTELRRGDFYDLADGSRYFVYTHADAEEIKICEVGLIKLFGYAPETLYFSNINAMKINNK